MLLYARAADFAGLSAARQATFGGRHTIRKLDAIEKYLPRLSDGHETARVITTYFFDAFAGTGDLSHRGRTCEHIRRGVGRTSFRGRVRPTRAARVVPSFDRYIFVEQMKGKAAELLQLSPIFRDFIQDIEYRSTLLRAPPKLDDIFEREPTGCRSSALFCSWIHSGNQVSFRERFYPWRRCNIDLWYLFPQPGIGVHRQISSDGAMLQFRQSLDRLYGTAGRRPRLSAKNVATLFGDRRPDREHPAPTSDTFHD